MNGYRTKQERIAIPGQADLVVRSLLDRQQHSDPDGAAERVGISSASWPMFGVLWPSATQLAARLGARPVRAGERILEVGCGLALASLVAHRRGADVTASDWHPLAPQFLAENLKLNGLAPMKYLHADWALTVGASEADGGEADADARARFDLIVGSDVLYERDAAQDLAGFVSRHAEHRCEVWIVDPERSNRPAFSRRMAEAGFVRREERLDVAPAPGVEPYRGRLLVYERTLAAGRPPRHQGTP